MGPRLCTRIFVFLIPQARIKPANAREISRVVSKGASRDTGGGGCRISYVLVWEDLLLCYFSRPVVCSRGHVSLSSETKREKARDFDVVRRALTQRVCRVHWIACTQTHRGEYMG